MLNVLDWFILTAGIVVILTASLIGITKIKSESEYLLANRKTSLFALVATLVMTEFNPSSLVSFSTLAYIGGWRGVFAPLIFLVGIGFYSFSVAKKYKEHNVTSIGEIFTQYYGKKVGQFTSLCLLFAMCGFCATYIKSLTLIFSPFVPQMGEWISSGFIVLLVLLMTLRGGLFSIIRIDIISFLGFLITVPLFFVFSMKNLDFSNLQDYKNIFPSSTVEETLPFSYLFSLIVLTSFTYILAPWYAQKIFSAKDKRTAFLGAMIAAVFVFFIYSLGGLPTFILHLTGKELFNEQLALNFALMQIVPSGILGSIFLIFFFAGATTLCGVWSAMSSMLVADFLPPEKDRSFVPSLIATLLFAILSYLLSNLFIDSVFQKMILANVFIFALSFALLGAFYWEKTSKIGAILSIIVGLVWGVFCYVYFGEKGMYTWYWTMYGLPLIFGVGVLGSLLFPNKTTKLAKVLNKV